MKRVRLIQPVKQAGARHRPGARLEMADADARDLEAIGVVDILGDAEDAGEIGEPDLIAITGGTMDAPIGEVTAPPPATKPTTKPARKAPVRKR